MCIIYEYVGTCYKQHFLSKLGTLVHYHYPSYDSRHIYVTKYKVYSTKVGIIVVGLLYTNSFSMHVHYSMGIHMPSLLVSDNVFRNSASVRMCVELQNALHLFEQQMHSQFYMRHLNLERGKENDAKQC